jgi:hypothetical protein
VIDQTIAQPQHGWRRLFQLRWERRDPAFSNFELWPWYVFYVPLMAQWLGLALRHRSLTLPTVVNPAMNAGGLCGEPKSEILSQFGREGKRWLAPYTSLTVGTGSGAPISDLPQALAALETAGIDFPFVAKPDVGCRGAGVRVVRNTDDLAAYIKGFPRGERVIFQTLVDEEGEAGVFYLRQPGQPTGRIFSLTLKYFPSVTGDGVRTLEQLVLADPRARRIADVYLKRHAAERHRVLAPGERFRLVFSGNHCRGAMFRNGAGDITQAMTARFDAIARGMPDFHFGRFDVRFASLDDLKRGENFTIIEVNGAGSEATHVWDKDMTLREAYATLFEQQRLLFGFAARNRARGYRPIGIYRLFRHYLRQQRLVHRYPSSS